MKRLWSTVFLETVEVEDDSFTEAHSSDRRLDFLSVVTKCVNQKEHPTGKKLKVIACFFTLLRVFSNFV